MQLDIRKRDWPFREPFVIASHARIHATTVQIVLRDGDHEGRAEAAGVAYLGETADLIVEALESMRERLSAGVSRDALLDLLPAGGARNALDCALWDLQAKRTGQPVWRLAGMVSPKHLTTACTISLGSPGTMAQSARSLRAFPILKLKLGGGQEDVARVAAVRDVRPDARLMVDANQGWSADELRAFAAPLAQLGVEMIEQPLAASDDAILLDYQSPVPLCADESCQTTASLAGLRGKYDFVNIKLDKAGGLTHALELLETARREGFGIVTGCMAGSSLGMAPAFLLGQLSDLVDLDTPLLLAHDQEPKIIYAGAMMREATCHLWG